MVSRIGKDHGSNNSSCYKIQATLRTQRMPYELQKSESTSELRFTLIHHEDLLVNSGAYVA